MKGNQKLDHVQLNTNYIMLNYGKEKYYECGTPLMKIHMRRGKKKKCYVYLCKRGVIFGIK